MTYDNFLVASKIKVEGTLALENIFSSPSLDFFIMLSSAVNIVGASGQANYNAGNSVQDALAQARQGSSSHFISLSIGWIEDAMHTADNQARLGGLRRAGLRPIQHDELSHIFNYTLGVSGRQHRMAQAVIGFDTSSLSQATASNGNIHSPMFCHLYEEPATKTAEDAATSTTASFGQLAAKGDMDSVADFIAKAITKQLGVLVSVDPSLIDERSGSILSLGLDSLVAIELRNWVMREYDAPLQSSEVLADQTIHALAEKIASRSRAVQSKGKPADDGKAKSVYDDGKESDDTKGTASDFSDKASHSVSTPSTPRSTGSRDMSIKLPHLPIPSLEDTLRLFEDSRVAVDSPEDQNATADAIQEFLKGPGPLLQRRLEDMNPEEIAEAYELQIYLERREPLQDYSDFIVGHPVNAPAHSQTMRAAVLTVAVMDFARRVEAGDMPLDTLHGEFITPEARNWLFYTIRRPGTGRDHVEKHSPNQIVAVLRRGHVFQLTLPSPDEPLDLATMYTTYEGIINASEEPRTPVCILTADERDSWAQVSQFHPLISLITIS